MRKHYLIAALSALIMASCGNLAYAQEGPLMPVDADKMQAPGALVVADSPPTVEACFLLIDYTQINSFEFALNHQHRITKTVDMSYVNRDGVIPLAPGAQTFYGNVLLVTFGTLDTITNKNDPLVSKFWIDWQANIERDPVKWLALLPTLENSRTIRLTYDPECGLVTDIEITSRR